MYDDPALLWEATLRHLRQHVSEANYETWLEGTEGVRLEGDTLVVGTRSEFVTAWLQKRLRPLILRTSTDLAERPIDVVFEPLRAPLDDAPVLQHQGPATTRPGMASYRRPRLRDRYVFKSFVVGPANRVSYAAAEGVAAAPGELYNPLFLYGAVGLGKTHLLQAIGHKLLDSGKRLIYVSAEQFTNELITSIQQRKQEEFRQRYRTADALLIDDIQFVGGKEATQEELFHTFNNLYEAGHQIVIASDKSPALIPELEERLRSRFEWGMTADIQAPDIETRIAILRTKAEEQNVRLDDDVLHVIARRFTNNIRELEGSLTRVLAYARLLGEAVTPTLVQSALASLEPSEPRLPPSPEVIMEVVCRYFEIDREALLSKSREKRVAYPRQLAMYLMRELAHRSLVEIGSTLGGRDHSTVHHGWRKMERSLQVDPETKRDVATLRELIERAREVA
ncbi:MAG: chromosomal replication initiator protein DnaA [Chloroflexi bacterium]|nr:chromosomal replication initiator protein DnaA [Chloroflexota bacterium]